MDTDRIPTQPTTADEPPGVTSLTPGPSQAPTPPAAGRGGRTALIGSVVGLALIVTFTAGIGVGRLLGPVVPGSGTAPNPASSLKPTDFGLIREAWDTIHQRYVGRDQLDDRALIYGAIEGMTEAVGDTGHTDFMTPEERKQRNDSLSGSYVGIGVRIEPDDQGRPKIVGVFDESPAKKAGLVPDDVIVEVDGRSTDGASIDLVAGWVRGEAGTTVELTVRRGADGPERTVELVRADVPIQPVSWTLVPGTKTTLIRLEQFSNGAADDVVEALKTAGAEGSQRVVLDLRGDPGGFVNEAVGVTSQFLSSGLVYIERNAAGDETEHPVSPNGVATDLPVVVLVDGNTASSAEIVAGALQDAGRAKIVGETTFGTGTVLGEFDLSDGSALRVGTTEWLTPKGRQIWHQGIAPDVPVALPEGSQPLTPEEVSKLSAAAARDVRDAQLAKALEIVATEAVAAR
ncbi:MAG TPA: S41 family peptidase [Candidatus Limnocylindrales bacterium]|jgi:carboxyl-terminal processing protease|nr:S41 family peptidase [Candidatus Limnocylindrales bacterium]